MLFFKRMDRRRYSKAARRRQLLQPLIERLEDRLLLAMVNWIGGSGDWNTVVNWSDGATNRLPNAGDDVFLDVAGGPLTITHGSGSDMVHSLHANRSNFVLSGGSLALSAAGKIDLAPGLFQWTGGTLGDGGGVKNVGAITLAGAGTKTLGGTLTNAGTITHGGTGGLSGGAVSLLAGGVYDLQADLAVPSITNSGTFIKSGGAETVTIHPFTNLGGTIDVRSGTLAVDGTHFADNSVGATWTGGNFQVSPGSMLRWTGSNAFARYELTGNYTSSGGGGVELADFGHTLIVGSAGAAFDFPSGMFQWREGRIDSGAAGLTNRGTITLAGPSVKTWLGTINNSGTILHAGSGDLAIEFGATLTNQVGAVYDLQANQSVFAAGTFNNRGTLRKWGGTGTSSMKPSLFRNEGGTIDVQTGTLELVPTNNATSTGGTFDVSVGAVLDLTTQSTGVYTGAYTGSGGGTVRLRLLGFFDQGFGLNVAGATFNFPIGMFQWLGGTLDAGAAGLNNTGSITLAGPDLKSLRGVFNNVGSIVHAGTGGLIFATANTVLNNLPGSLYDIQGDVSFSGAGGGYTTFNNAGTLRKSAGTGISTNSGVDIQNLGGTIDVQTGDFMLKPSSNPSAAHTGGTFRVAKDALLDLNGGAGFSRAVFQGSYSGSGEGFVLLRTGTLTVGAGGAVFDFPPGLFQWVEGAIDGSIAPMTNRGTMTLQDSGIQPFIAGQFNNAGTFISIDSANLYFKGHTGEVTLTNLPGGVFEFQGGGGLVAPQPGNNDQTNFINQGTLRKSGPGTATINTTIFSNSGRLAVDAGTMRIQSATISQVAGSTLSAGTWQVSAGSSIDLASAPTLTTNSAIVILDGPGSTFAKLHALAANSGSLSLLNDRDFTTAGPLTNTGSLTVGAGSTLSVTGTYSQTAGATLSAQLGGDPSSGKFGQLTSTGAATLDGTFNVALTGGFGPAVGQSFQVMSFPSHTGSFSAYTGLRFGRFPLFEANLAATNLVLNALTSTADLAFDSFDIPSFPTSAVSGQNLTLTYRAKNLSTLPATGDWIDSLYLSADGVLDPSDALLARVNHHGDVGGLGSYSETVTAALPPLANGAYRVIVLADSRGLATDANRGNNTGVSSQAIAVTVPLLVIGTPVTGSIEPGRDIYYRVLVAPGAEVTLAADFAALPGAEVSVRYAALPDQTNRDDTAPAGQLHSRLLLSNAQGGTYYLRLHGREDAGGVAFTLSAAEAGFEIFSVSPLKGSNLAVPSIITLLGARFTPQTQVLLRLLGGGTRAAQSVEFISANKLVATVDLAGLSIGDYEVVAIDAGKTAVALDAFTATNKDGGATEAWISALAFVKVGAVIKLKLTYHNSSDNPLPAPLVEIRATDVGDPGADETTGALTLDSLAGYLPAGYFHEYNPFKTYGTSPKLPGTSTFSLFIVEPSQTPINWGSQKATLRPSMIPPDAWNAVWDNLGPQLGETLSDLNQFLEITALKLREAGGELVEKLDRLLTFELQKANNLPAVQVPAAAVDIAFPAPGVPLVFGRRLGDTIAGRYQLGRLGRGWIDNFDISIHEDAEHLVTISQGGGVRFFKRQPDGSYRGAVGEFGTLTKVNGAFQLREKTGGVTAFRADGLLDFIEDTNSNRITAGYTGTQLTSLTHSSGAALTLSYAGGRLHQVTDPAGRVATYDYDASGEHLLRVTTTAGTTEYAYTADVDGPRAHALTSITSPDGTHLFFDYDSHGRLARKQGDGGANTLRYTYDTASYSVTDARDQVTTVFYDDSFRIRKVSDPLGRLSYINYDAANNPVVVGATGGGEGKLGYDALGNPTSVQDPLGEVQAFTYEPSRNRFVTWKDPLGQKTEFSRDANGNLLTTAYADGSTQQYSYNTQGNVVGTVNRLGQIIRFTYNSSGQVTRKDLPDGTSVAYTYNARGDLETVADATGTTRLEHLDANPDLLTKITYSTGRFLEYTYQNGRRTRMVDQSGFSVNYSYDAAGRLDVLRDGSGGVIVDYDYDLLGRLARETRGNFTVTLYAYDNAGQLLEITNRGADASIQSQIIYTYDNLGRRTSAKTDGALTKYGYDGTGRLTSVALPTGRLIAYAYDAEGNRTTSKDSGATATYTVNKLNEYVAFGSTTQTFDAAGNLVSSSIPGGSTSYHYDAEGRLVSQITPTGTWVYQYDALGNRIASIHDGVRKEYLVDPSRLGNVVGEYDGAGNLQAHYVDGLGLTSRVDAAGTAAYYQFDAGGNTTHLTGAGGAVLNSYSYLPFGESLGSSETVANPFEYVGQFGVMREGSGIDYMRNRWYDPRQGRFTQADPIGLAGGTNVYAYVHNNPVTHVDPSGLNPLLLTPEAIAAVQWVVAGLEAGALDATIGTAVASPFVGFGVVEDATLVSATLAAPVVVAPVVAAPVIGFGEFVGFGVFGAIGAISVLSIGITIGQFGVTAVTGQVPNCVPYIPHSLQACEDPGSSLIEDLVDIIEPTFIIKLPVQRVGSMDPNDIVGPAGFGAQEFVVPQAALPYRIDFQNLPAATGPAAEVVVTHVLDADLDLDTFALEDFGFGDLTVPVPAGRQSYSTRLDLRSTRGIFVDVAAGLDRVTRTVTWRLQAIDPETLDLPISPFVGFLPPDKVAPEGQGFVSFSVRAREASPTGTRIDAQARIIFDTNDPIDTNLWTNTIDAGPPSSHATVLPTTSPASFNVSWSGSDDTGGSGIGTYDIFVSLDGGSFTPWLSATTQTSAIYTGQNGHRYAFYSVATDNVGHVELAPSLADASTTVFINSPPTLTSVSLTPATAFETSTLTATPVGGADADGDAITYRYQWIVNGSAIAPTTNTLGGAFFNKGNTVSVRVTPNDGTVDGAPVSSNSITISNSPPTLASVSLTPTTAFATSTLTAAVVGGADADGDTITYRYQWFVNGSAIAPTTSTLGSPFFSAGNTVSVRVTPDDGTTNGTPVNSNSVIISAPVAVDVTSLLTFRYYGAQYNSRTKTYAFYGTITNKSNQSIRGPVQLGWSQISPVTAQAVGANGAWSNGAPYFDLSGFLGSDGILQPGETSQPRTFAIKVVAPGAYSFTTTVTGVLPSGLNRANYLSAGPNLKDTVAPESHVASMPEKNGSSDILVAWGGADEAYGSGVASFDIYVAQDSGAYILWIEGSQELSAKYAGKNGHTYAFYSVAHDLVGNSELLPLESDMETAILYWPKHNQLNGLDVSDDGSISPLDALLIINYLNAQGARSVLTEIVAAPYFDTSADNAISPLDVILVINRLNRYRRSGEGESSGSNELSVRAFPMSGTAVDRSYEAMDEERPDSHYDGQNFELVRPTSKRPEALAQDSALVFFPIDPSAGRSKRTSQPRNSDLAICELSAGELDSVLNEFVVPTP